MTALLVIAGAIIAFAAGWWWARRNLTDDGAVAAPALPAPSYSVTDVLDGHPSGVVVADRGGTVHYRNVAARRHQGTHAGVLLDGAIERHLARARSGVASAETVELYGPPKQVFDVVGHALPDGGSVVFVDDVSERRRVDQVRTDFVANISHELKTPIGALAVLAETLVGETDPTTIERVVNRMLAEADRASETIDDLMELSRIEAGGDRVDEPVRVSDVVRGALARVTELAAQRHIAISSLEPVDGGAHRTDGLVVAGDRRQLVSAVGNLVENAVKYSDPDTSVQVRARLLDGWVEISVTDQGPGIPARDVDRIFERFYRVDRARSRTTGGTGLGLAIVRHVASNHGGDVQVRSIEGEGSTFVLRLPAIVATGRTVPGARPPGLHPASDRAANQPANDQGVA